MIAVLLAYITELVLLRALEVTEESFDNDIDIHVKAGQDLAALYSFSRFAKGSNQCSLGRIVPIVVIDFLAWIGIIGYLICTDVSFPKCAPDGLGAECHSIRADHERDIYITAGVNALTYLFLVTLPLQKLLPRAPTIWKKVAVAIFCLGGLIVAVIAGMRCLQAYKTGETVRVDVKGRDLMIGEMFTAIVTSSIYSLLSTFLEVDDTDENKGEEIEE
ncbi:hypothetical protein ACLX1H_001336 [Fusarium chlamydosporum]